MRVGSIVRLVRPWDYEMVYKDVLGVVEDMDISTHDTYDSCRVRIVERGAHYVFTCFKNRFEVAKE